MIPDCTVNQINAVAQSNKCNSADTQSNRSNGRAGDREVLMLRLGTR